MIFEYAIQNKIFKKQLFPLNIGSLISNFTSRDILKKKLLLHKIFLIYIFVAEYIIIQSFIYYFYKIIMNNSSDSRNAKIKYKIIFG